MPSKNDKKATFHPTRGSILEKKGPCFGEEKCVLQRVGEIKTVPI